MGRCRRVRLPLLLVRDKRKVQVRCVGYLCNVFHGNTQIPHILVLDTGAFASPKRSLPCWSSHIAQGLTDGVARGLAVSVTVARTCANPLRVLYGGSVKVIQSHSHSFFLSSWEVCSIAHILLPENSYGPSVYRNVLICKCSGLSNSGCWSCGKGME